MAGRMAPWTSVALMSRPPDSFSPAVVPFPAAPESSWFQRSGISEREGGITCAA